MRAAHRRKLTLVGWGLFAGLLVALWRDPGMVQDLRLLGREGSSEETPAPCGLASGDVCTATFNDGTTVQLQAGPVPLPVASPLHFTVTVSDPTLTVQGVELTGVSMPMGVSALSQVSASPGQWQGKGALPACTAARMLWQADVLLAHDDDDDRRVAGFQFWTSPGRAAADGRGAAAPSAPDATFSDFTVQTASGSLSLSDLRGQVVLLYFGYTACPDVCPTTLARLGAAVAQLPVHDQARVTGLMVSLDPARDELARLETYTHYFHPRFSGGTLTDPDQLDALTADWDIAWSISKLPGSALAYAVDHPAESLLVGRDGQFIERLSHDLDTDQLAARISAALREP